MRNRLPLDRLGALTHSTLLRVILSLPAVSPSTPLRALSLSNPSKDELVERASRLSPTARTKRLYYVGCGGNSNTTTRFRRYTGTGDRPLRPRHERPAPADLLRGNVAYHIMLVVAGGRESENLLRPPSRTGSLGYQAMNSPRRSMLGLLALALTAAQAVERLPIEDFSREFTTARARLSPDGKRLALIREDLGKPALHISDIDQNRVLRLDLGEATLLNNASKQVLSFAWGSDRRLVISTVVWDDFFYGVIATDWDGSRGVPISGYEDNQINLSIPKQYFREIIDRFYDKDQTILRLDRHEGESVGSTNRPDILHVDTMTGMADRGGAMSGVSIPWCNCWPTAATPCCR